MDTNTSKDIYCGLTVVDQRNVLRNQEFEFLDTIEIEAYLQHEDWSVLKIMDEIQEDHGAEYKDESYIFNAIEVDDFIQYVHRRFKGKYTFYVYLETRVHKAEA